MHDNNKVEVVALSIQRRYMKMDSDDLNLTVKKNINFVAENSLCHGCGTCESACPSDAVHLFFEEKRGIYLPEIDENKCDDCEICVQVCSGFELDLTVRPESQKNLKEHELIGAYAQIYRAYTNNRERRLRAASGGVVTELVDHLLSTGKIDGAVLTRMNHDNPLRAEGFIARTSSDLIPSQKSKYCPVPLNKILKPLVHNKHVDRLAFVGLPHHVHGLRLLQRVYPHMRESIPYVISIFTAHVPSQRATDFILYKNNINPSDVAEIEYRGGGIPGRMRILTKDGSEFFVPHLHWTYSGHSFPIFFYPVREWLYFDKLSEWSDFSMGDNWTKWLKEQQGASTVITRSVVANNIIQEMVECGKIGAFNMTEDELVVDQNLEVKLNVYWRLKVWRFLGRKIPIYNRNFKTIKFDIVRTFRFAAYVMLCERDIHFSIMDKIIKADYYLRGRPMKFFRKVGKFLKFGINIFKLDREEVPVKEKKYKVVLIGGFGYDDIGDEAMPHAVRNNLRKALGDDLEIMMLSPYPKCTNETHREKSNYDFNYISHDLGASPIRKMVSLVMTVLLLFATLLEKYGLRLSLWNNARQALNEIKSADVILNVGGGNINSVIPSELYKKCTTFIIASILKKPVFLSGQTMGPYNGIVGKTYARIALNKVKMISFRDKETSLLRLKDIGVEAPIMFDAADDAITLKGIQYKEAERILENETGLKFSHLKNGLLIALNMKASLSVFKGKGRESDLAKEVDLMAKIADKIINNYSCRVVFMPTDFSDTVDDRKVHKQIYDKIQNKDLAYTINNPYIDDELIGMIACADIAIGARYHFNVFAASRNIPFLGIASGVYQRTKLKGLSGLCGLKECYVDHDMEFVTLEEVWPYVKKVIDNRVEIKRKLSERVPTLKENSLGVVNAVVDHLKSTVDCD